MNSERGRGFERGIDGGELIVAGRAAAVVESGRTAEPTTVAALDGLELLFHQLPRAGRISLAHDANPGTAERREIALRDLFVGGLRRRFRDSGLRSFAGRIGESLPRFSLFGWLRGG